MAGMLPNATGRSEQHKPCPHSHKITSPTWKTSGEQIMPFSPSHSNTLGGSPTATCCSQGWSFLPLHSNFARPLSPLHPTQLGSHLCCSQAILVTHRSVQPQTFSSLCLGLPLGAYLLLRIVGLLEAEIITVSH